MKANKYQRKVMETANTDLTEYQALQDGVMGLNGEAGECIDIVKKHLFQGHGLDKIHLAEELGDVAWYLAYTANTIGYSLNGIFQINIDKLKKRYPNGFNEEDSVNRDDVLKWNKQSQSMSLNEAIDIINVLSTKGLQKRLETEMEDNE